MTELELILAAVVAVLLGTHVLWALHLMACRDEIKALERRAEMYRTIAIRRAAKMRTIRETPAEDLGAAHVKHVWPRKPATSGDKWDTYLCKLCPQQRTVRVGEQP